MTDYVLDGYVKNLKNEPLSGLSIIVHDFVFVLDKILTKSSTDNNGHFRIPVNIPILDKITKPKIYLSIEDPSNEFKSVTLNHQLCQRVDDKDRIKWKGPILDLDSTNNITIKIAIVKPRSIPPEYDAVVIGSGFGGTIMALTIANKFQNEGAPGRVCVLERGQWWISHEMPDGPDGTTNGKETIRGYLDKSDHPYYSMWAYPDNVEGFFKIFASSRPINPNGVYDYRALGNVHVIAGNAVGGGSMVYSNVTERPPNSVYATWATENSDTKLDEQYFVKAENFIMKNKIVTTAGLGSFLLPRAKVFQEAAKEIRVKNESDATAILKIMNENDDYGVSLSITEIPQGITPNDLAKYQNQQNVCQRQGRCVLGCIPGARHTMNKKLFDALQKNLPLDVLPLCEVDKIEPLTNDPKGYKYQIVLHDLTYADPSKKIADQKDNLTRKIKTKMIVLSSGSLGSTEILLRSKDELGLNEKTLGSKFTTNGDLLGVINPTNEIVDASRGPIVTSIAKFANKDGKFILSIEDSGIPKMFAEAFAFMFNMMSKDKDEANIAKIDLIKFVEEQFIKNIMNNKDEIKKLISVATSASLPAPTLNSLTQTFQEIFAKVFGTSKAPEEKVSNILMLSGMGIDEGNGRLTLADDQTVTLKENYKLDHPVFEQIIKAMEQFAQQTGQDQKDSLLIPLWNKEPGNRTQFVLHPLGGCPMGNDASDGVVDHLGRLFKGNSGKNFNENFYVVDGSIIPTPIGVNPSLTISALAFRIATKLFGIDITKP